MNFKINSRPLFTIIFKLKSDNFKTRDFSPLIERVLAGVWLVFGTEFQHETKPKQIVKLEILNAKILICQKC